MYSFSYLEPVCVPCPVLTVASWPAYKFLKRQIRWSGIPISFRILHSLLWSDCIELSIFGCKEYNQFDFGVDHLVMSMCRVFSCVVGRGCLLWPVHYLGKTVLANYKLPCLHDFCSLMLFLHDAEMEPSSSNRRTIYCSTKTLIKGL